MNKLYLIPQMFWFMCIGAAIGSFLGKDYLGCMFYVVNAGLQHYCRNNLKKRYEAKK